VVGEGGTEKKVVVVVVERRVVTIDDIMITMMRRRRIRSRKGGLKNISNYFYIAPTSTIVPPFF
jgi:hypothetical protein